MASRSSSSASSFARRLLRSRSTSTTFSLRSSTNPASNSYSSSASNVRCYSSTQRQHPKSKSLSLPTASSSISEIKSILPALTDAKEGKNGLFTMESVKEIERAQEDLWRKLQEEIASKPILSTKYGSTVSASANDLDLIDVITFTARNPTLSSAFSYATEILNNSFFIDRLASSSSSSSSSSASFSSASASPQHLETEFLGRAKGLKRPGNLWLVKFGTSAQATVGVLPTYGNGGGTILVRDGANQVGWFESVWRPTTTTTMTKDSDASSEVSPETSAPTSAPTASESATIPTSRSTSSQNALEHITPLAVCTLSPYAWVPKYGDSTEGKEKYVKDWFRALDWDKIRRQLQ